MARPTSANLPDFQAIHSRTQASPAPQWMIVSHSAHRHLAHILGSFVSISIRFSCQTSGSRKSAKANSIASAATTVLHVPNEVNQSEGRTQPNAL
jgi:hypothetical protein